MKNNMIHFLRYGRDIILLYLFFSFIAFFSQLPDLQISDITFLFKEYFSHLYYYSINLFHGDFGTYYMGRRERIIIDDITIYTWNSMKLLIISSILTILISLTIGIFSSINKKSSRVNDKIITLLNSIPDFIFILILQVIVVAINKAIGVNIINIASFGESEAFLLPLLTMVIIPSIYLIRGVINDTSTIITEDYIRTALAKGLSKGAIVKQHVISNLIPIIKSDMVKVLSISIGNLFIVEYLFNIRGITSFLFEWNQYAVWMTGFLILAIMYIIIYFVLCIILVFIKRILVGE